MVKDKFSDSNNYVEIKSGLKVESVVLIDQYD